MKQSISENQAKTELDNMIGIICDVAKAGLVRCYADSPRVLPYSLKFDSANVVRPEGFSLRYAAISQIGIAEWLKFHPSDKRNLPDLWPVISDNFPRITDIGDIALSLWAGIQSCADDCDKFIRALEEKWPAQSSRCNAVELGWVVQACSMAQQSGLVKVNLESVLDDSHKRLLLLFDTEAGLFYRHHRSGLREIISRHIACFADQVYPILALSNCGVFLNHNQSIEFAAQATEKICQYQGQLGQWWWHYDVTHKRICEEYPVFTVHQDGMAPMAVMASDRASKQDHFDRIVLGMRWTFGANELGENLVHQEDGIIWRDIERDEPAKLSRKVRSICSVAGLSGLHHLTGRCVNDFRVNREFRSYHFGWILYAWASRKTTAD